MSTAVQEMEADLITVLKTEITNKFGKTGVDLSEVHQGSSKGMKVIQVQCSCAVEVVPVSQSSVQVIYTFTAALFQLIR